MLAKGTVQVCDIKLIGNEAARELWLSLNMIHQFLVFIY